MIGFERVLNGADCPDHPLGLDPGVTDGATTIVAMGGCECTPWNTEYDTCGSYCDTGSFAVAKLSDGRVLVVSESSDTSGHGCRCSGSANIFGSLEEAVRLGLGDWEREKAREWLVGAKK